MAYMPDGSGIPRRGSSSAALSAAQLAKFNALPDKAQDGQVVAPEQEVVFGKKTYVNNTAANVTLSTPVVDPVADGLTHSPSAGVTPPEQDKLAELPDAASDGLVVVPDAEILFQGKRFKNNTAANVTLSTPVVDPVADGLTDVSNDGGYKFFYPDVTARTTPTGYTPTAKDVTDRREFYQLSDDTIWRATNHAPLTWTEVSSTEDAPVTNDLENFGLTVGQPQLVRVKDSIDADVKDGLWSYDGTATLTNVSEEENDETVAIPLTGGTQNLYIHSASLAHATAWQRRYLDITDNAIKNVEGKLKGHLVQPTDPSGEKSIRQLVALGAGITIAPVNAVDILLPDGCTLDGIEVCAFMGVTCTHSVAFDLATMGVGTVLNATGQIRLLGDGWWRLVMLGSAGINFNAGTLYPTVGGSKVFPATPSTAFYLSRIQFTEATEKPYAETGATNLP